MLPGHEASGVPAGRFDPAAYDTALTADGYGWLASLLPAPQPPACEACVLQGGPGCCPVADDDCAATADRMV
jgi:hypothetical protein